MKRILARDLSDADIGSFRTAVAARPLSTLDDLHTAPKHIAMSFESELDRMVAHGWERDGQRIPTLAPPIPWDRYHRSFSFHLHAWDPITFLLKGHSVVRHAEKAAGYFDISFAFASHWMEEFQLSALDSPPAEVLKDNTEETFAWYDMAVGQRAYRLAYILDVIARNASYSDQTVALFLRALRFHMALLSEEKFFRAHSNHGLYQALGQLASARRFCWLDDFEAARKLAERRLGIVINEHFTTSNVHKEHSPGYHYMVLGSLIGATQTDLITDPAILLRLEGMQRVLTWMFQPDRGLATIGDTDPRDMNRSEKFAERFSDPELKAIFNRHNDSHPPPLGVQSYFDAGYAFARLHPNPQSAKLDECSYLAQHAGFHSRVHKHADHLSFIWHDRGSPILIDPGRYAYSGRTEIGSPLFNQGFWYSDPRRIYVESTRAHNAVEIDGESYPRYRVKPFGSALKRADEQQGLVITECELFQMRRIRHYRALIMKPRKFLIVIDWLHDRSGEPHDYRQWFTLAPCWRLEVDNRQWRALSEGKETPGIACAALLPDITTGAHAHGQEEPDMLGWTSNAAHSVVPTWSACFEQTAVATARFATLWTFADKLGIDSGSRANASLKVGQFGWVADGHKHSLKFDRRVNNELSVEYRSPSLSD